MKATAALLLLLAALIGCAGSGTKSSGSGDSAVAVVDAYIAAFNRHDSAAAARLLAPDLQWLAIEKSTATLEANSRSAMQQWLRDYFIATPDVRSKIETFGRGNSRVGVYECVSWTNAGVPQRRCAHGLFEVRAGLIHRVWFWPAEG